MHLGFFKHKNALCVNGLLQYRRTKRSPCILVEFIASDRKKRFLHPFQQKPICNGMQNMLDDPNCNQFNWSTQSSSQLSIKRHGFRNSIDVSIALMYQNATNSNSICKDVLPTLPQVRLWCSLGVRIQRYVGNQHCD